MRKKIWLTVLAAAFLTACNAENDTTKKETSTEAETSSETASETKTVEGFPQLTKEVAPDEALVQMNTSEGAIQIKLFPELAPKAVENFLTHAEKGYYDGLLFHRVIEDFMLQGGDPTGTGGGGESIYGEPFEDEFSDNLYNFRGALSMANAGPGTNGSQFFIVQASEVPESNIPSDYPEEVKKAYSEIGGTPWLDGAHTVFGQVIEGMEVVDAIAAAETQQDRPVEDITIESIEILQQ
ncbi:peptidylprolyl isomerase [Planococcus shenhongbingii]|uniref:Peptidyl-prolyl cis-trans isomerase n=1 Tax=Planococcus shenhongbingii TaxID=3058398 RepID=A0ABT8NH95_9BACL|nr:MULTISPECIES: peptidylprolyl isomerase [unclassified Planococcus (in: firmicutes)]MDN7247206.1 peptidylprolyl isomerase [Planococcus sp. N017]WKA59769.1 peptidylprolyl isomerase [Planococcus sp. N016]